MIDWISGIESKIYSRVKHNIQGEIIAKFPDARFTSSSQSSGVSKLPCVYIHEIEMNETARNTEGDSIESVVYPMEVRVTVNTQREDVKWITSLVIEEYKKMRFNLSYLSPVLTEANTYYRVARFRRTIGSVDDI